MAGLERILLWIVAAILGTVGMVHYFMPQEESGPVFLPAQTETVTQQSSPALPERVPGTSLRIQALVQYEGPFWEDGTGEYVSNVAALLLYNPTGVDIMDGQVLLTLQDQEYEFAFTYLPAGGRLLVPEKNRLPYVQEKITDCRCGKLVAGEFGTEVSGIQMTPEGMSGIVLENQTDRDLENVQIYYKLYLSEDALYVGGRTYQMPVGNLPAGGKQKITPENFLWGYSAVVDIATGVK